jgi:4'-phosphopantetheinyl transferase
MNVEFTLLMAGPGHVPELAGNEAHLWCARFDLSRRPAGALADLLSADEQERGARFHFEKDRHRFVYTRGWLRRLLGGYLGVPAASLRFDYSPKGKPEVPDRSLHFNLSDSGELAVFAFSRDGPVGVDIEQCRPSMDWPAIAKSHFAPSENEALRALAEADRLAAFFACWTRKEAWLKAMGYGLSYPLDAVEVECRPGAPARLVRLGGDQEAAAKWALQSLTAEAGYAGCLAVPSGPRTVRAWKWREDEHG